MGSEDSRLGVIRRNSAPGKSSVAYGIRERFGRVLAMAGQDDRDAGVPQATPDAEYPTRPTERESRARYGERHLLPGGVGTVIGAAGLLHETVDHLVRDAGRRSRRRETSETVGRTPHEGGHLAHSDGLKFRWGRLIPWKREALWLTSMFRNV
ncbi:hypothetical protein [Streptomyces sp. NPDC006691]|uniref:hypothetical protein n=1 Tax=Streptomyces sp. NPDC006691 TaxID=3364757 RepID=UPI0036A4AAFD